MSNISNPIKKEAVSWITSVFTLIGLMIGVLVFFNGLYVSKDELHRERELRMIIQDQTNKQIEDLSTLIYKSHIRLASDIKESKIYGIMIRRDLLESRNNLTIEEIAELRLLNRKIAELSRATTTFDTTDINMKMEISDMIDHIDQEPEQQ